MSAPFSPSLSLFSSQVDTFAPMLLKWQHLPFFLLLCSRSHDSRHDPCQGVVMLPVSGSGPVRWILALAGTHRHAG